MPSFTSLTAFASLAFAAIGSALPLGPVQRGLQDATLDMSLARRHHGVYDTEAPGDYSDGLSNKYYPSTSSDLSPLDIDILTRIASAFGVKVEALIGVIRGGVPKTNAYQARGVAELLAEVGVDVDNIANPAHNAIPIASDNNVEAANSKAIQSRELDINQITAIANYLQVKVEEVVSVVGNDPQILNNVIIGAANPHAIQSRGLPVYHVDIIDVISNYFHIDIEEVLKIIGNKISVLENPNLEVANAKSIQTRGSDYKHLFPGDIAILTIFAKYFNVEVEELLKLADNKIAILPDAHVEVLNAKAYQTTRGEYHSLPDIIVELTAKLNPLGDHIREITYANADVEAAVDLCIPILEDIKGLLVAVRVEIEALVTSHVEGALTLHGKVVSIKVVAELFVSLCTTVIVALGLVVKVAATTVKIDIVLALAAEIGAALSVIIGLGIKLAGGLLAYLVLPASVVHIIFDLELTALIKILQLTPYKTA